MTLNFSQFVRFTNKQCISSLALMHFSQFTSRNASSFKITSTPTTPSIYPEHSCLDSTTLTFRKRVNVFWVTEAPHVQLLVAVIVTASLCKCCRGRCTLWPLGLLQLHLRLLLQHFLLPLPDRAVAPAAAGSR